MPLGTGADCVKTRALSFGSDYMAILRHQTLVSLSISPDIPIDSITSNAETKACKELLNSGKTKFVDYESIFAGASSTIGANGRFIELIMTATHKVHSFLLRMVCCDERARCGQ
jgi:hypothetical protein